MQTRPAPPAAPIDATGRAQARLKAASVDAIFAGSPFERRFRDIHTLAQAIQSRDGRYEPVGQMLLGNPPEVFFSRGPPFSITVRRLVLASLSLLCSAELNPCSGDLIPCSPA